MTNAPHDGRALFKKFDAIFAIERKAYAVGTVQPIAMR
jgi:hypothetical protein